MRFKRWRPDCQRYNQSYRDLNFIFILYRVWVVGVVLFSFRDQVSLCCPNWTQIYNCLTSGSSVVGVIMHTLAPRLSPVFISFSIQTEPHGLKVGHLSIPVRSTLNFPTSLPLYCTHEEKLKSWIILANME